MRKKRVTGCAGVGMICLASVSAGEDLDQILEQYAWVEQIEMFANVQLTINDGGELCCTDIGVESIAPIEGTVTYFADGVNWRLDSHMDPSRYPGMDSTLLYNGAEFAYYDAAQGLLSTQDDEANPDVWGMMLPNPAFEALQFLFPMEDSNAHRQTRLVDAQALAASTTIAGVVWSVHVVDGVMLDRAEFPGGVYENEAYTFHVYAKAEAHSRPLIIDRVDGNGGLLTRTRLSNYQTISVAGGETAWPRVVSWQVYDPLDGLVVVEMSAIVESWSLNGEAVIPSSAFSSGSLGAAMHVHEGVIQP